MNNSIFKLAATLSVVLLLGAVCQSQTGTNTNGINANSKVNSNTSLEVPAPNSNVNETSVVNTEEEETNENVNTGEDENSNENVNEPEEGVNENVNTVEGDEADEQESDDEDDEVSTVVVTYNGSSFSPSSVTLTAGGTLTIVNNSSRSLQVSSNNHPAHTKNPELGTGPTTAAGASYTVTLSKLGTWGFHDHLNPSALGTVIVQ